MNRYFSRYVRRRSVAALAAFAALALCACQQGAQGDRCNPDLIQPGGAIPQYNEDECNSGLACTIPPTCVIAICCPKEPPYADPNCACLANPGAACACTVPGLLDAGDDGGDSDAGSDAATDAATDAAPDAPADARADAPSDAQTDGAAK
jgi:hypothetical protein